MLTIEQKNNNEIRFMELLTKLNIDLTEINKLLDQVDFFNKPASTQYMGAYPGGLCEHVLKVAHELGVLCNAYFPGRYTEEDVIKVAFFKDLYKATMYETYMKNVNSLPQYRGKDSLVSEYVILDENVLTELENKYKKEPVDNSINYEELDISDDTKLRWGSGYTNEDYKFLEDTYKEFTDVYESRTPAQRLIFKNIAKSLLEGDKALRNNNPKIFENMNNVVSKLMTDGNIKPIQEASVAEDDTASWGKWINLIEQERPIGEPLEHFKDVDKISSYITKWFTRQMQRVFDLSTGDNDDN
jgi:hypothetical protein